MMRYKRILCGVDFSPSSQAAFLAACEMARVHRSALHVLHVIEARPAVPADALLATIEQANQAMARLVESEQSALEGLSLTTKAINGRAFDEITRHAKEWNANLIVIGAKGISAPEEVFVGGTAESVTREGPCSVLIVRLQSNS